MARCLQSIQLSFGVLVLLLADRFDPVQDFWGVERCGGSVNVLVKYAHATNVKSVVDFPRKRCVGAAYGMRNYLLLRAQTVTQGP